MRVPHLGITARIVLLSTLLCVCAGSILLVRPASAAVFTIPTSVLQDTSNFKKGWGPAAVSRANGPGLSVDFTFTGLGTGGTGVKDDYPVAGDVYGQRPGGEGGDFSNLSGFTIRVENLDTGPIWIQNCMNTGFTGGSGTPSWDGTNDTFWYPKEGKRYVGPGETIILYLDFNAAAAWNIPDNKSPHTGGGLSWPNGGVYSINDFDRHQVSAVGFEVADNSGSNPDATIRVTPLVLDPIGVTLVPATTLKNCGGMITYQVMVDGFALDLMGANYTIHYDNTKLTFVSAVVGSLLSTGPHFFTSQDLDGGGGGGRMVLINSAHFDTGVAGPGEIAELTFNTIGSTIPGSTALTFSDTDLRDSGNQTLPSTWTGASVTIDCVNPTISVTLNAPPSPWTCYNSAPTVNISASDDYNLDCVKYNIDGGSWTDIVCGISGTSYTNTGWVLPSFAGLSEGSHTYYFKATDDAGNESTVASVTFTKDTHAPGAVTGFTATVGHNAITLKWTNPGSDVNRIILYRNDWTDYPGYSTADPGYPTVGAHSWQHDAGVVQTYTDAFSNTTRGIYAYRAVVYDCAGNSSDVTGGDHGRATSYYLGDIANSGGQYLPNYDGLVSGFDYNPFSGCYWSRPPTGSCMEADFGPTIEPARGRFGIPRPDGYVGFEDLMIFAMNYGNVPPPPAPAPSFVGVGLTACGLVDQTSGYTLSLKDVSGTDGMVQLALVVEGSDGFKGLSAAVDYDHSALQFVSVTPAAGILGGSSRVLFMGDEVEGAVRVDLAVLGAGVAIGGNGPVATLSFQRKGEEAGSVSIETADARDVDNTTLKVSFTGREIQVEPGTPKEFALRGNSPNPFSASTVVHYDVPKASPVRLTVYNVHGQAIRTLVDEVIPAGRHSATWDGLDGTGRLVAPGIYFCEMSSDNFVATHKMLISR